MEQLPVKTHGPEPHHIVDASQERLPNLRLKQQEIPFDHSESCNCFHPSTDKPFVAAPSALKRFGLPMIMSCLQKLQILAIEHDGIDCLQVFEADDGGEALWFIEDGQGGGITALLPSDY